MEWLGLRVLAHFGKPLVPPTNAISGVVLTLNSDGSINLNFGAVEIGPGMKTIVAQIFAEKWRWM